jgi:branched-chain amino acid transport system permease protein
MSRTDGELRGEGLRCVFGGLAAVDGVSFALRRGEILSLVGPNGAGKTTTLNLITGFLNPSGGRCLLDGQDITGASPDRVARLGVLRTFQQPRLVHAMSVRENAVLGAYPWTRGGFLRGLVGWRGPGEREAREMADRALRRVGLGGLADLPSEVLGSGQQRQLELARLLVGRPRFLLLDEPAAGLTGEERQNLGAFLRELRADGYGVLLVEHDMKLVMGISDRVLVMNSGRPIKEGPPDEVRTDPEVIACYLGRDPGELDPARPGAGQA